MSRAKINIDKVDLVKKIDELEANGPLENRGMLFAKLAELFDVSTATIYNRFRELNLSAKTPLGKKGRAKGTVVVREAGVISDTDKASFARLKQHMGKPLNKLVDKVQAGSKTAAIKLMCIECSGGLTEDKDGSLSKIPAKLIKDCGCLQCPLWTLRPYQN